MKKSLITGAAALALATVPTFSVFAVGVGNATQDVTVGEVDETVYSVDINWGDMTFDWKYNKNANSFSFMPQLSCNTVAVFPDGAEWLESVQDLEQLYSDKLCTELYSGDIEENATYYYDAGLENVAVKPESWIYVRDESSNGKTNFSYSFTAEDDYDWVSGGFAEYALVSSDRKTITYYNDSEEYKTASGLTSVGYRPSKYFYLENDGDSQHVNSGDKIGTITITISPDTNPVNVGE